MSTKITEIIPDDIPKWAKDAMDRGQLFNEIVKREEDARRLAVELRELKLLTGCPYQKHQITPCNTCYHLPAQINIAEQ